MCLAHVAKMCSMKDPIDPLACADRLMVSGATDATVSLFELGTLTCLRTSSKFDYPARGVCFSHDSLYIAFFAEGSNGVHVERTFTGN